MFKIGEFSRIAHTPISQLRYYDQIGLFQPEHTDPFSNYRYYSARQLPRLNRILALRDLGLSLEQIARSLDQEVELEEMRGMLALRKAQIEQEVQTEILRLRAVEARLRQIEREGDPPPDVLIKAVSEQEILGYRQQYSQLLDTFSVMEEILHLLPAKVGEQQLGNFTAIIHSEGFGFEDVDVELGFAVLEAGVEPFELPSGRRLKRHRLPAAEHVATAIRVGPLENGFEIYAAVGAWVEEHGYRIAGLVRESFIVPPRVGHEAETTVEIQVPIRAAPRERWALHPS